METVTISRDDQYQCIGVVVTCEDIERLYEVSVPVPRNTLHLQRNFDSYSYLGEIIQLKCSTQEEADVYLKKELLYRWARHEDLAYIRFGFQHPKGELPSLSRRDVYAFRTLVEWSRKRLVLPAVTQPHLFASMYPIYFRDYRRGFMIEQSAYEMFAEKCRHSEAILRAIRGTLVVVV